MWYSLATTKLHYTSTFDLYPFSEQVGLAIGNGKGQYQNMPKSLWNPSVFNDVLVGSFNPFEKY